MFSPTAVVTNTYRVEGKLIDKICQKVGMVGYMPGKICQRVGKPHKNEESRQTSDPSTIQIQKYENKYNYKMRRQIPVRRALRTSAPCPESHRRLARRFPSPASSDENRPKTVRLINIVLTLLQGELTGNHRLTRVPMFRRSSARQRQRRAL